METPFGPQPLSFARPPTDFSGPDYPRPTTLPQFRLFWDHLGSVDYWYLDDFEPATLFVYKSASSGMPLHIFDVFEPCDGVDCDSLDLRFRDEVGLLKQPMPVRNWTDRDTTWHFLHALKEVPVQGNETEPVMRLALAAAAQRDSVPLRAAFIHEVGMKAVDAEFAEAFPNLVAVTALYPGLSVDTLAVLLRDELIRTNYDVGLLGTPVPRAAVAVLGPVLLFLAQMYLLAHMRLVRDGSNYDRSGWLGAYRSKLAKGMSLFACVVLPVSSGVLVFVRFHPRPASEFVLGLAALIGMALASTFIVLELASFESPASSHDE